MSIKQEKQENKNLNKHNIEDKEMPGNKEGKKKKENNLKEIEYNFPGIASIKAKNIIEAKEKFKNLKNNKKNIWQRH